MCLAIPGKIIALNKGKATVKYSTVKNYALIGDEKVNVGDWVMVQMGIIVQKLNEADALKILQNWR